MESSTYKSKVPGREQRQQFPSPTFSCHIFKSSLSKTVFKPTVWKGYIWDDIFSLWDISKPRRHRNFFEQVNFHHPIMKFTAEISDTETIFFPEGGGGSKCLYREDEYHFLNICRVYQEKDFFFCTCRETDRTLQLALRVLAYVYLLLG